MSSSTKLFICSKSSQSHFLRVSKTTVILLEILPFLTQSQKDGGEREDWFTRPHLQEVINLLKEKDVVPCTNHKQDSTDASCNKRFPSRFIVTGTTIRAACVFKQRNEGDIFLMPKKLKGVGKKFQEIKKVEIKVLIHVCPKTNSSVMNLSQLVESDANGNADNDQISKYFQPVADH